MLVEFSSVQLAVAAGQFLGLMLANLLAGSIASILQSKHQHEIKGVKKYANGLYYTAGILLLLVACFDQKLYLAAPYRYKQTNLSLSEGIKAAFLSSTVLILLATVIFFVARQNMSSAFQLFSSGFVESMLSVAGMLVSLVPYILMGFIKLPMAQNKSIKTASLITFFLIISTIYALFQDLFVSFIGFKIAELYYFLYLA
ncbi:MAG TPA: hypothetical protein EYQ42_08315 [Thiotrichaceae bacterium]|nr:hypothetical protein [Thiotrichaceae bacterium]HIL75585.1 hypothetical protein [Rhodospirillales bacterium]